MNVPSCKPLPRGLLPTAIVVMALCSILLGACQVTRRLDVQQDQRLLVKNTIALATPEKIGRNEKSLLKGELASFIRQKPNRKFIYSTRMRLWLFYQFRNKTTRFADWINNVIAEPPTLLNVPEMQRTARNFENQMRQRGFLEATCDYAVDTLRHRKAAVTYTVQLGVRYRIDSIVFASRDSAVLDILNFTKSQSLLHRGAPLDGRAFDAEKLRITTEMKNRGYAYFVPNFVEFTGDTVARKTNVLAEVLTPGDSLLHKTYTIGSISVLSGLVPDVNVMRTDMTLNGIYFASSNPTFDVKVSRLYNAIALRPGWPYRQVDFDLTNRKLNDLGVFRPPSIKYYRDNQNPDKINVDINLVANKRFSFGWDFDFNHSNSSNAITGRLLGLATYLTFQNRNIFGGAENLQTTIQYNIEFDAAGLSDRFIFAQGFKFQNDLVFPKFVDYLSAWRLLNNINIGRRHVLSDRFHTALRTDGKTQLGLTYNYLQLFGFYRYHLFNIGYGISLQDGPKHRYALSHIGIDVLRPEKDSLFENVFGKNQFLRQSFGDQLFTGFLLRSFGYNFAKPVNRFGETYTFNLAFELSGLEEWALNRLWSRAFGEEKWKFGTLEYSKFAKIDLSGAYLRKFNDRGIVGALRLSLGAGTPFGDTKSVPYVEQFFVGGPSSIRAWRIRELGPGSYYNEEASKVRPYYQTGDFRMEFNAELRFPMMRYVKGAVFVDGGNIWSIRPDDDRPGAQLRWNSYKNIALGTGVGIRTDFEYFILRFDFGLKLRKPYLREAGDTYWVQNLISKMEWKDWNLNLAVGLPF